INTSVAPKISAQKSIMVIFIGRDMIKIREISLAILANLVTFNIGWKSRIYPERKDDRTDEKVFIT
ncbi:hypothetical protein ACMWNY_27950, partial [Klebsiella pneumoniae]